MPEADDRLTHKLTGREVLIDDGFRQQERRCHPDAGGSNDAMIEQEVLFIQETVSSLIHPPAAVPPPPPPSPAVQTAMLNRLRAYRADNPAAYEKANKKT